MIETNKIISRKIIIGISVLLIILGTLPLRSIREIVIKIRKIDPITYPCKYGPIENADVKLNKKIKLRIEYPYSLFNFIFLPI